MRRLLLFSLLIIIFLPGCTSNKDAKFAGRYSRTTNYPKYTGLANYTNTTELKPDGTFADCTNRGGNYRVLATGTYEVNGNTITFHDSTNYPARPVETYTDRFNGRVIFTGPLKRIKE